MAEPAFRSVWRPHMTRLSIERAPQESLPRRFLLSAPLWGMAGGVLLCVDGPSVLLNRWHPATLALLHVYALGVLGNAMFGSLLQFVPVVIGANAPLPHWLGALLHILLNLGILLLVGGLHAGWTAGLVAAGMALPLSFMVLAAMLLPGIFKAAAQHLLRIGIAVALASALVAAILGGWFALGLAGVMVAPTSAWVDVHASWGVLGWMIVLIASVARIVMPMFQGTGSMPAALQATWLGSLLLSLAIAGWERLSHGDTTPLRYVVATHVLLFACALLWLQWRAARPRRGPLLNSWRIGLIVLASAAWVLLTDAHGGLLSAVLGLAFALPLMVNGMALEIVAFLGWIDLHRRVGRGVQLPGVQRLLPARNKSLGLLTQVVAGLLMVAAVCWPSSWLARTAGVSIVLAWTCLLLLLLGVRRRANHFLRAAAERP